MARATTTRHPVPKERSWFLTCWRPRQYSGVPGSLGSDFGSGHRHSAVVRAPLRPAPTQVPGLARSGRGVNPTLGSLVWSKGEPLDPGQDRRQQNLVSFFPAFIGTGYWWCCPIPKYVCPDFVLTPASSLGVYPAEEEAQSSPRVIVLLKWKAFAPREAGRRFWGNSAPLRNPHSQNLLSTCSHAPASST